MYWKCPFCGKEFSKDTTPAGMGMIKENHLRSHGYSLEATRKAGYKV